MKHKDTADTASGNTKKKSRCFLLTWNNYEIQDYDFVKNYIDEECKEGVVQEEIGEEGTEHLQFFLYYNNARSWDSVKKIFNECHIEVAKNLFAARKYCMKDDTRNGNRYIKGQRTVTDPLNNKELYPWQILCNKIINKECDNDRYIHWFWEPLGCCGKTTYCKHHCLLNPKNTIFLSGRAADCKNGVVRHLENPLHSLNTVFFHFTRTIENHVSYEAIESIKDGIFFSGKYEASMCMFNTPHVICFANFKPHIDVLSKDRWKIYKIDNAEKTLTSPEFVWPTPLTSGGVGGDEDSSE